MRPPIPSFGLPPDSSQDDESEVSVDSSDSDASSSDEDAPLSLHERMLRNQQRNAQFLESLNEKYQDHLPVTPKATSNRYKKRKSIAGEIVTVPDGPRAGMPRAKLFPKTVRANSLSERLQALLQSYPHRHGQIRRLMAILSSPATIPVLVTGPRGVGKTTVVRDVVHALDVNAAYINCMTLEPFSMERLVADVMKQLRCKRKRGVLLVEPRETIPNVAHSAPPEDISNPKDTQVLRSQPQRAAKVAVVTPSLPTASFKETSLDQPELGSSLDSPVVSLGRSLQGLSKTAILIVDHAERLPDNGLAELLLLPKVMSVRLRIVILSRFSILMGMRIDALASPEKSSSTVATSVGGLTVSFPAYQDSAAIKEILKAPKVLSLIIGKYKTNQAFLIKVVDSFLTSLVQFLSDTTNDINEYIRVGNSLWPLYIDPLTPHQIQETLTSLGVTTRDETVDREILGLLSRRFLRDIGKLSSQLTLLPLDSHHPLVSAPVTIPKVPFSVSHLGLPFLRSCLLLACFICQNNRADTDRKMFSVHGNGKRRKTRGGDESREEELAFASTGTGVEQLKSLRPRPFLVERAFSIFVTLVRLNPDATPQLPGIKRHEYIADDLGGTRLYEDLHQLVDLGLIHPVTFSGDVRGEQINFNSAKFWCSLPLHEASNLAQKIGIPLDSYLI